MGSRRSEASLLASAVSASTGSVWSSGGHPGNAVQISFEGPQCEVAGGAREAPLAGLDRLMEQLPCSGEVGIAIGDELYRRLDVIVLKLPAGPLLELTKELDRVRAFHGVEVDE